MPHYADIGKAAKDLLTGSAKSGAFSFDPKLSFTTTTASGVTFAVSGISKGDKLDGSLKVSYSHGKKYTADANFDASKGNVTVTTTLADIFPSAKLSCSCVLPDPSTAKLGVEYSIPYLGVKSTVSVSSAPLVDLAAATGYKNIILGSEVAYDTAKSDLTKYNFGVGYHAPDFQAALFLVDKAATAKFTYSHNVASGQIVGAEVTKKLSGDAPAVFTLAVSKVLSSGALAKLKIDNSGAAAALYETKMSTGETVAASMQLQATDLTKPVKYGFALTLF